MAEEKKFLSRDEILAADDRPFEVVTVPEWGGAVRVYVMSAELGAQYGHMIENLPDDKYLATAVVFTACNEAGEPLFGVEDVDRLAAKNKIAVQRVARVAIRLNRFTASEIDQMVEDFLPTQNGDSPSD
jgi:hypothetical protein